MPQNRHCLALILGLTIGVSLAPDNLTVSVQAAELQSARGRLALSPPQMLLHGPESSLQVLLSSTQGGRTIDRTPEATFTIEDPAIAVVDDHGRVEPRGEGVTRLLVQLGDQQVSAPLEVIGFQQPGPISFNDEVIPVLTRAACNSGGCHGKAEGQNGFKLSIFGFDAAADYNAIVKESRGRRVNPASPAHSLLIRKATAQIPHGGGKALDPESFGARRLVRWLQEGALPSPEPLALEGTEAEEGPPGPLPTAAELARQPMGTAVRIEVEPSERLLSLGGDSLAGRRQQLRAIAFDAAGRRRDVTAEAAFETNAPTIAEVDERGLISGYDTPGEAAILVRYMGHIAVCRISIPRVDQDFVRPAEVNFIDQLSWDKMEQMGVQPSGLCDDATFLRRAYLDVTGTLPAVAEAARFLDDNDPQKRSLLIDDLLQRDEYANYWSLRWADLLRVDAAGLGAAPAYAMTRWLRRQFAENRPYDDMVRNILTARGPLEAETPAAFYGLLNGPKEQAGSVSQVFLGIRIECAECHHHPFERWSQQDYYAFAGFFSGVRMKRMPDKTQAVVGGPSVPMKHPRTGELVPVAGLGDALEPPAAALAIKTYKAERLEQTREAVLAGRADNADAREELADWMLRQENPFFARAAANRIWAFYFGRGLVDPIDDMRASNPASNEALLDALADHLKEQDYDLKAFTRTLMNSRLYQQSATTNLSNAADEQLFSHASYRSMPAEVLLDSICQATGVAEKFQGTPAGYRATELWDSRTESYFLRIFGRPGRTTVCACERGDSPTISQSLHLMNSPEIAAKVQHRLGRARRLADSEAPPLAIIEEIYLATLSRRPTPGEMTLMTQLFEDDQIDRRTATEDVFWTLLNTKEFLFNH
ncbi:DUF1549 and DUF1553 domain-containing protein [Lignipirellula cremea]|uniref:DUF1549 and DUF1553 domain-containing protein n=1 Tax=Lignipirellula cremea TaxID=2528010 RepID=UPI0018D235ED|nr:DUF1549 and DUF1553 domain-containing protein [Lignipirellula cremea]